LDTSSYKYNYSSGTGTVECDRLAFVGLYTCSVFENQTALQRLDSESQIGRETIESTYKHVLRKSLNEAIIQLKYSPRGVKFGAIRTKRRHLRPFVSRD